jgi:hypothetical protein
VDSYRFGIAKILQKLQLYFARAVIRWMSANGGNQMRYGLCRALVLAAVTMFSASSYAGHYGALNLFQSVSGHYSGYDQHERMYVAGTYGDIYEIVWRRGIYYLATPPGALQAIASYYDNAYGDEHVIAATSVGIEEIWYRPGHGVHTDWIYNPGYDPGFISVGAFYSPSDNNQHVVAATNLTLMEFWWGPTTGGVQSRELITFPDPFYFSIKTVSAYFTPVDKVMHAVVLLQNGEVYEVWWYFSDFLPYHYTYSSHILSWGPDSTGASGFGRTTGYAFNHEDFLGNWHGPGYSEVIDYTWDADIIQLVTGRSAADIVAVSGWYIPGVEKAAVFGDDKGLVSWTVENDDSGWTDASAVAYCDEAGGCSYIGP